VDACESSIQDRIAWNYEGNRRWGKNNLRNLCAGAVNSRAPGRCFNKVMHKGVEWSHGSKSNRKWKWKNALRLCAGTLNARRTIDCFKSKIENHRPWNVAISACRTRSEDESWSNSGNAGEHSHVSCVGSIQHKIAWNYRGNRKWNSTNLRRLCTGAEDSRAPGRCFNTVMHKGVNWGGGTKWKWKNAIRLCHGTKNSFRTIACFKNQVGRHVPWLKAIKACAGHY